MRTIVVTKRDAKKRLADEIMPAVFYGRKEASTPISLSRHEFEKVWRDVGESSVVTLKGVGEDKEALIHDVDLHPVTDAPRHADFYIIEKGRKVSVKVPIEFVGEAPAIEDLGGTLVKVLHEIEVEALPKDLPHEITVDISVLKNFNSHVALKDVFFPDGVIPTHDREEIVVSVSVPNEEEEEPSGDIDMEAIEVEEKGKVKDTETSEKANLKDSGQEQNTKNDSSSTDS